MKIGVSAEYLDTALAGGALCVERSPIPRDVAPDVALSPAKIERIKELHS
jgi:hypothetical protein